MIPITKAEKATDLSIKLMLPWKHIRKSHHKTKYPLRYAAVTALMPATMALGLTIFLVAIWFLPDPPQN
jgi:hypothetical protein